jgi:2-polyprenyl-3-methyl-5-hydroxy-6-metoxy-1,4-benzoquinol methylase
MALYSGALDEIAGFAQSHYNITIRDFDGPWMQSAIAVERYDAALLLAVIEHLNGSPRALIQRIKEVIKPHGMLVVQAPNVASLGRRIHFLKGASPFPAMSDYFHSDYPFTGHNREYTIAEIEYVIKESGLVVEKIEAFHDNPAWGPGWKARLIRLLETLGPRTWRPSIWAYGRSA